MTIYVDQILEYPNCKLRYKRWCHMATDGDLSELHQMAARLSLHPSWFQTRPGKHLPHYNLTPNKRAQAVRLGVQEVDTMELVRRCPMFTGVVALPLIKCLSIYQPYASWLADPARFLASGVPPKRLENRDWATRYRGPLLIHASKQFEDSAFIWAARFPNLASCVSRERAAYPAGAIVGVADLVDCVSVSDDPWFCGEYGFVLANARPVGPAPYRGAPGLFDVPYAVVAAFLSPEGTGRP